MVSFLSTLPTYSLRPAAKWSERDEVKQMEPTAKQFRKRRREKRGPKLNRVGYLEGKISRLFNGFKPNVTLTDIANWQAISPVYIQFEPIIFLWKTPNISFITAHGATPTLATHVWNPTSPTSGNFSLCGSVGFLNTSLEVWCTWKELRDSTEHGVHHHTDATQRGLCQASCWLCRTRRPYSKIIMPQFWKRIKASAPLTLFVSL